MIIVNTQAKRMNRPNAYFNLNLTPPLEYKKKFIFKADVTTKFLKQCSHHLHTKHLNNYFYKKLFYIFI